MYKCVEQQVDHFRRELVLVIQFHQGLSGNSKSLDHPERLLAPVDLRHHLILTLGN